ncbi:MAG: hypothetical protein JF565_12255 [Propionibacteriales bacterium]|nr:hypothetical protein [Propionibacteriales bacterium]
MSNYTWPNTTVVRSTLVVPTYGFGMGEVCPQAAGASVSGTPMRKRHLDAIQATKGSALPPWSPPVT